MAEKEKNGVAAKVRGTEERLTKLESRVEKIKMFLEEMYQHDLDGDGRIGGMARFGKTLLSIVGLCLMTGIASAVPQSGAAIFNLTGPTPADYTNDVFQVTTNGDVKIDGTLTAGGGQTISGDVVVSGAATVTGKTTCNGELEVNNDVDINLLATNRVVTIDQTNVVGLAGTPLIKITDARTGASANTAGEATLVITPSGTHAISVTAGISALQAVEGTTVTGSGLGTFASLSVTGTVSSAAITAAIVASTNVTWPDAAIAASIARDTEVIASTNVVWPDAAIESTIARDSEVNSATNAVLASALSGDHTGTVSGLAAASVTNGATLGAAALQPNAMTYIFTNVIWEAGVKTGNWTFVNGQLTAHD